MIPGQAKAPFHETHISVKFINCKQNRWNIPVRFYSKCPPVKITAAVTSVVPNCPGHLMLTVATCEVRLQNIKHQGTKEILYKYEQ